MGTDHCSCWEDHSEACCLCDYDDDTDGTCRRKPRRACKRADVDRLRDEIARLQEELADAEEALRLAKTEKTT